VCGLDTPLLAQFQAVVNPARVLSKLKAMEMQHICSLVAQSTLFTDKTFLVIDYVVLQSRKASD
jgi:hypothetical protein